MQGGRRRIGIDNKSWLSSRLHYISIYGRVPINLDIDHINRINSDDRIENLRKVTRSQNNTNRGNAKGYHWNKRLGKWLAEIKTSNERVYLGVFSEEVEAAEAYQEAKKKYHVIKEFKDEQ